MRGAIGRRLCAREYSLLTGQRGGPLNALTLFALLTPCSAAEASSQTRVRALQVIATLQHLQCLGLSRCPAAHAPALPALVAALPRLTRLQLNNVPMSDLALSPLLRVSPAHCSQRDA